MGNAAVGFRVHSGWATVVLLVGSAAAPEVADRRVVQLADPAVPDSRQPYHAGLDLPKGEAARTMARLVRSVIWRSIPVAESVRVEREDAWKQR